MISRDLEWKNKLIITLIVLITISNTVLYIVNEMKVPHYILFWIVLGASSYIILSLLQFWIYPNSTKYNVEKDSKENNFANIAWFYVIEIVKMIIVMIYSLAISLLFIFNFDLTDRRTFLFSLISASTIAYFLNILFNSFVHNIPYIAAKKKRVEDDLKKYDIQKFFSILATITTILALCDTAASSAYPTDLDKGISFENYLFSDSYRILIPSLSIIVLYIRIQIFYGFDLIKKEDNTSNLKSM